MNKRFFPKMGISFQKLFYIIATLNLDCYLSTRVFLHPVFTNFTAYRRVRFTNCYMPNGLPKSLSNFKGKIKGTQEGAIFRNFANIP